MAKIESSFKNMVLVLTGITLVAALLLGGVYELTKAPIAQAELSKQLEAIQLVAPPFDNEPMAEMVLVGVSANDSLEVYPTKKNGELTGVVVKANTNQGFSGNIYIMVGIDAKGVLQGFSVLSHAETPGLGSKMQEWFGNEANPRQSVIGRLLSDNELKVNKDGGDVDAITAATITSRAFLNAINRANFVMKNYMGQSTQAISGASAQKSNETENQQKQ